MANVISDYDSARVQQEQDTNPYGGPLGPTGSGLSFLGGLSFGVKGKSVAQMAADPFGGGRTENYSPALLAQFLKGEMGPGGFLGAASQQRQTALGMAGILSGGAADFAAAQRSMAARGVAMPALAAMRSANRSIMAEQARGYLAQRRGEQDELRYRAMEGFVNSIMQSVAASKAQQSQEYVAAKSAKATERAGTMGALGSIIGGILGGPVGAAIGAAAGGSGD